MIELIERIRTSAEERHIPVIHREGALRLQKEVSRINPLRILEIGCAVGYSGLLMLSACPYSSLLTVEIDGDRAEEARNNFAKANVTSRVRLIEDDAAKLIPCLTEPFDFIFLDGPKGQYPSMFPLLLSLLNPNGEIMIDDMTYHGWIEGEDYPTHKHRTIIVGLRKFIKDLQDNPNIEVDFLDEGEGIVLVRKKSEKR